MKTVMLPGWQVLPLDIFPGARIVNSSDKTLYVRLHKRSVTVSDRKPAKYGVRK
jgi:hypothetical protein